ncbi:DUF1684 domain-containing protein [Flavobacterium sediminilitoris]|uniref:DUF1684 domain-containing protein n=1 Tax=Flavobacterium sediminilitoris TaxID=2024526 RepID=A0ABY4HHY7_9FLAO|nr:MULTISPECIES: DUF1684 domain-containing protein [Flavobacterium]UOX32445.1 DUF1684 domain-containing protein [Flavobacterium sediminilitoris]
MYKYLIILLIFNFTIAQNAEVKEAYEFQEQMNQEFADSLKSPLTDEDRLYFKTLDFYPVNEKLIVEAVFVKVKKEKPFKMKTSTDRTPMYKKYGELHFKIDGNDYMLNVYQNIELSRKPGFKDYLFLPFSDLTCGKESYIGGRYIDMRIPTSDKVIINFNKAYNPYCAYNYKYSCPIVPLENDLDIAIEAGVKKYHD